MNGLTIEGKWFSLQKEHELGGNSIWEKRPRTKTISPRICDAFVECGFGSVVETN